MDRNHTARFQKKGPRALRTADREAFACVEQECEKYVRGRMQPELIQAARQARSAFRRERGR